MSQGQLLQGPGSRGLRVGLILLCTGPTLTRVDMQRLPSPLGRAGHAGVCVHAATKCGTPGCSHGNLNLQHYCWSLLEGRVLEGPAHIPSPAESCSSPCQPSGHRTPEGALEGQQEMGWGTVWGSSICELLIPLVPGVG